MAERDRNHWRSIRNALAASMRDRGITADEKEITFIARFFLEELESKGLFVVPNKPTKDMNAASRHALDIGKRTDEGWVGAHQKHRQRLIAAIEAAPNWRVGMQEDPSV